MANRPGIARTNDGPDDVNTTGQVEHRLDCLGHEVETLANWVSTLEDRLITVLRNNDALPAKEGICSVVDRETQVPLAETIQILDDRLTTIRFRVTDIYNRIEL